MSTVTETPEIDVQKPEIEMEFWFREQSGDWVVLKLHRRTLPHVQRGGYMSDTEIAACLGVTKGTVDRQLHDALRKCRERGAKLIANQVGKPS